MHVQGTLRVSNLSTKPGSYTACMQRYLVKRISTLHPNLLFETSFLVQSHAELAVTSLTVHRLVITAVMLAAKLMDDNYYNNAFYAKIGGVTLSELNHMELEMLRMLDYRIVVSSSRLHELLGRLEVFQAPGRIVSVLCRKRSSYMPDSSSAALPSLVGLHKPRLAKSHVAKQQAQQPLLSSSKVGRISTQTTSGQTSSDRTTSDQHCDIIQTGPSVMSQVRYGASAHCGVGCGESTQLVEPYISVVDVSA